MCECVICGDPVKVELVDNEGDCPNVICEGCAKERIGIDMSAYFGAWERNE